MFCLRTKNTNKTPNKEKIAKDIKKNKEPLKSSLIASTKILLNIKRKNNIRV